MWHSVSAKVGTHFADKRLSLGFTSFVDIWFTIYSYELPVFLPSVDLCLQSREISREKEARQ
jgi:hypothetical protein